MDTFDLLIKFGADLNLQDENGYSALHYATSRNNIEAVQSIVESDFKKYEV